MSLLVVKIGISCSGLEMFARGERTFTLCPAMPVVRNKATDMNDVWF